MRLFCRAALPVLACLPGLVAPRFAPGQAPTASPVAELVQRLDSADLSVRVDATDQLYGDRSITLRQLEEQLKIDDLSPEQRQRLGTVAFRRFLEGPHAAMGVQSNTGASGQGAVVASLPAGFAAAEVLRVNDRIIVADGILIDSWDKLRAVIVSRDPGDVIPITVVREGATLNLRVKLGNYANLNQRGQIEQQILEKAWAIRGRAFIPEQATPTVIGSAISVSEWQLAGGWPDEAPPADFAAADSSRTSVVAGGEPRSGPPGRQNGAVLTRTFNSRVAPGPARLDGPFDAAADLGQVQQRQLDRFQQVRDAFAARLAENNRRLMDPATPDSAREGLREEVSDLISRIRALDIQIQALQTELNRVPRR